MRAFGSHSLEKELSFRWHSPGWWPWSLELQMLWERAAKWSLPCFLHHPNYILVWFPNLFPWSFTVPPKWSLSNMADPDGWQHGGPWWLSSMEGPDALATWRSWWLSNVVDPDGWTIWQTLMAEQHGGLCSKEFFLYPQNFFSTLLPGNESLWTTVSFGDEDVHARCSWSRCWSWPHASEEGCAALALQRLLPWRGLYAIWNTIF